MLSVFSDSINTVQNVLRQLNRLLRTIVVAQLSTGFVSEAIRFFKLTDDLIKCIHLVMVRGWSVSVVHVFEYAVRCV